MAEKMTKADRGSLAQLARKRAKVAKSLIGERIKVLKAEVEDQLSAEHRIDDELWVDLTRAAREAVAQADQRIAERCRQIGIPEELRPSIALSWIGRGDNMLASRRSELRKLAHARIEAKAETAKVEIDANLLNVETELIRDGLESAEALAFVDAMPTVQELMPSIDVGALPQSRRTPRELADEARADLYDDLDRPYRYAGWQPPMEAAGQLLTPTTATGREQKRQAIAQAIAANPGGSDRAIARAAGVDHHTAGKYREQGGEIPASAGEVPTSPDDAEGAER